MRTRFLPCSLAQYSALSARRISSSRPTPWTGNVATPALTVIDSSCSRSIERRRSTIEDAVAGGMSVAVVDALEVVDVDEAEAERQVCVLRRDELALQALVEVSVVAE